MVKSLGLTKILVYCKGVYLLVCAGVGDFKMLARVISEFYEGICGLREIDEEALFSKRVLFDFCDPSGGPYCSLDVGFPLILRPVESLWLENLEDSFSLP